MVGRGELLKETRGERQVHDDLGAKSLQRIFLKPHRLTKFGTVNRFKEINFWFNEKHKKSQFCVTSLKRSIMFTLQLLRVLIGPFRCLRLWSLTKVIIVVLVL